MSEQRKLGEITAKWVSVNEKLPAQDLEVDTKIDDGRGVRNEQSMKLVGRLWYVPDGSMYVYYTPTHWRPKQDRLLRGGE